MAIKLGGVLSEIQKTTWLLDTKPPRVSLSTAIPKLDKTGERILTLNSDDATSIRYATGPRSDDGCFDVQWKDWQPVGSISLHDEDFPLSGEKQLCLIGRDLAGNIQPIPSMYLFTIDRTPPTVTISVSDIAAPESTPGILTKLFGTGHDADSKIVAVKVSLQEAGGKCLNAAKTTFDADCPMWFPGTVSTDSEGQTNWIAEVNDSIFSHRFTYKISALTTDSAGNNSTTADKEFTWKLPPGSLVWQHYYDFKNKQNEQILYGASVIDATGNTYALFNTYTPAISGSYNQMVLRKYNVNFEQIWEWRASVGVVNSTAKALIFDSDGNLIAGGAAPNLVGSTTDQDWWFAKFNTDGTKIWEKAAGDLGVDLLSAIAAGPSGSFFGVGSGYNLVTGASGQDMRLRKFDQNGNPVAGWDKSFSNGTAESFKAVAVDGVGNVYAAGYSYRIISASSGDDWVIKKYNASGTEITTGWDKRIGLLSNIKDNANALAIDSANNVYVGGLYNATQWRIEKFNAAGTSQTGFPITVNIGASSLTTLLVDSTDRLFAGGYATPGTSGRDFWIRGYQSNGTQFFDHQYSPLTVSANDEVYNLYMDPLSGGTRIIAAGSGYINNGVSSTGTGIFRNITIATSTASSTNSLLNLASFGDDEIKEVAEQPNGNLIVAGVVRNYISLTSGYDAFVYRLDRKGKFIEGSLSVYDVGSGNDAATTIKVAANGTYFVGGYSTNLINSSSKADWWVRKFSASGIEDLAAMYSYGQNLDDEISAMELDSVGNLYVAGFSTDKVGVGTGKDLLIKKFGPDNAEITTGGWPYSYDESNGDARIRDIMLTSQGKLAVVSTRMTNVFLQSYRLKLLNSDGTEDLVNWNKFSDLLVNSDRSVEYTSVIEAPGGDLIFTGNQWSMSICFDGTCDLQSMAMARYTSNGTQVYENYLNIGINETVNSSALAKNGRIWAAGTSELLMSYDSYTDACIQQLDLNGNTVGTAFGFGSKKTEKFNKVRANAVGDMLYAGQFPGLNSTISNKDGVVLKFAGYD